MDYSVYLHDLSEGAQLFTFLEGHWYHLQQAIIGQPVKHHLNGVSLAGRCWPNIRSFVTFQGIQTSIAMEPYSFQILEGVRTPSGSAHES